MNRLSKVSLGLVALLLMAMLVFTGCGHSKLEEGINNAQSTADSAKTEAAVNLTDAKASLEAAIAAKADAETLAAEVAKLNAALEAAKAAYATADGALKVELDAAIAAAKATIMAEGENLVMALDAKLVELLNSKASTAALEAEIDRLNKIIDEMKAITDNAMNGDEFRNLNTTKTAYTYILEGRVEYYTDSRLYADKADRIEEASRLAYISIINAQNIDDLKFAMSEFEALFLTDEVKSFVDVHYLSVVAAENNKNLTFDEINALCALLYSEIDNEVEGYYYILAYHDGTNLYERAVTVYANLLTPVVSELADRYILPNGVVVDENNSGAKDLEDLAAARAEAIKLAGFITAVDADATNVEIDEIINNSFSLRLYEFRTAEARAALLKSAVDAANNAAALDKGYNDVAEGEETTSNPLVLTQTVVNDLDKWNDAIDLWNATYNTKPVEEDKVTADTWARYSALVALISETEAEMNEDIAAMKELTAQYKADALEFQLIVSKFYNVPATGADDLYFGNLDANCSKVTLASGTDIKNALDAYDAFILKYPAGAGTLDDADNDETPIVYEATDKKVFTSHEELQKIAKAYYAQASVALDAWDENKVVNVEELTVDNITIYDTSVKAALEWFDGTYLPKDADGALVWDTVNGEPAYNLFKENYSDKAKVVTKAYYDALVALNTKLDQLVAEKKAAADTIKTKFEALKAAGVYTADDTNSVKLSQKAAVTELKGLVDAYLSTELTQNKYVAENTELNDARGFTITTALQEELAGFVTRVATLQGKLDAIKAAADALDAKATEAYDPETKQFKTAELETAYIGLKDDLKGLIEAFITIAEENKGDNEFNGLVEGKDGDATVTAAKKSLLTAQQNIVRDIVYAERAALLALNLGPVSELFAAEAGGEICTKTEYETALKALVDAVNPATPYEGVPNAVLLGLTMADVVQTIEDAKRILALDNVYETLDILDAALPTAEAYPYFADADARAAYVQLIANIKTAIGTSYTVSGYPIEEGNCDDAYTLAADDADLEAVYDAIDAAEELVARDIVGEKFAALKALDYNDDEYKYFVNDNAKDTYKTAANALKKAIDDYDALIAISGVARHADVTAAETEQGNADTRVAKYETFEGYYGDIYERAIVASSVHAESATIIEELKTLYTPYVNNVTNGWTVEDMNNTQRQADFLTNINKVLAKYSIAALEAPEASEAK